MYCTFFLFFFFFLREADAFLRISMQQMEDQVIDQPAVTFVDIPRILSTSANGQPFMTEYTFCKPINQAFSFVIKSSLISN